MDRRTTIVAIVLGTLTALGAPAQQAPLPSRLGFLRITAPPRAYLDAFEQGLRELGRVPGRDLVIDYRFADGDEDRLRRLAAELVASKVDVILVAGAQATNAAKNATGAIPVVMVVGGGDPVASGFVASLSRPGGNITGQKIIIDDTLTGKRLELLKQIRPDISRVAVLVNRANVAHPAFLVQAVAAASALAINVQAVEVDVPAGLDEAFAIMAKGRAEALVYLEDAEVLSNVEQIVRRAVRVRLPTVHTQRNGVDAGGLMSYGPSIIDSYRNSAAFVDKILKGAKPGDLPIEQPTKFELVINMKAAKTLGLTIPPSLLSRADEVIQ